MDARRSRTVIDPKIRQVGFVPPNYQTDHPQSDIITGSSPPVSDHSPAGTLSPVIIPPPLHPPDSFTSSVGFAQPIPVPLLRRPTIDSMPPGSYNPSDFVLGSSPLLSPASIRDGGVVELLEDLNSPRWTRNNTPTKLATSCPGVGVAAAITQNNLDSFFNNLPTVSMAGLPPDASEKTNASMLGTQSEQITGAKPLKEKLSKAEKRALQEAQRAAKAAAKEEGGSKAVIASGIKQPNPVKKDNALASVASIEKKGADRLSEKDKKKDIPHPRMQFDDMQRVEKIKKRAVVKQIDSQNRVELFRHLPQYIHGTRVPELESKFFQLGPMHPAIYKIGLMYMAGDVSGGNARCIAMLQAFKEVIRDYSTPPEKNFIRDLTTRISNCVSFLNECRPLAISMGNAIRTLKNRIACLPQTLSELEAKATLQLDIDNFINEKIVLADKVIVKHAVTKIRDGDVLLTYGSSSVVEMILLCAHELGKCFHVVIVDSRPKLEAQSLLRTLVARGISCTYTLVNAISYIMHEVTRVLLGAAAVLANGTVYSRVGTSCVAMVAHEFHVPVLVCCEAYKFHERVQLDSICSNELGDPNAISHVHGRKDLNDLENWGTSKNLQLLNLLYDVTPTDYVSMIVTDYGMVPPTSVPVIVREYRKEHLWI